MATKQIDEYYESLAYWKQQALDHEQELRDIKYNTIMNITAEVEQLKAENDRLKKTVEYQIEKYTELDSKPSDFQIMENQVEIIQQLKSKLEKATESLKGLMPEVYCLYQQYTGRRIDKEERDDCAVVTKYAKARELLKEIEG